MKPSQLIRVLLLTLPLSTVSVGAAADSELLSAIKDEDTRAARELIDAGVNINRIEADGSRALHWAVYQSAPALVSTLIEAGAEVSVTNREGITPLALAVQNGDAEITRALLRAGADVNRPLGHGETPLMMAARTGDTETIRILLDKGADIDATEELRGTTALMWAAANGNAPAMDLLLASGADYSIHSGTTTEGHDPYLAPKATERIKDFYRGVGQAGNFVSQGEADSEDSADSPPVNLTREELVARLPDRLVQEFEREFAREEQRDDARAQTRENQRGGLAALHFAVREDCLSCVRMLMESGADVNQLSAYGWSPLLTAVKNRYYDIGKYLLEQGADPNIANAGGWNALYLATDNRNIEGGDYPVRKPKELGHMEMIELLLEAGADPNMRMASSTETRTIFTQQWLYEDGATPFLRAAQSSDVELMQVLLDHGADPTITTRDGVNALMVAAGIGWVEGVTYEWSEAANEEAVRMLLDLGLDASAQDTEAERTALMGAAHKGRPEIVRMLVDAGARLDTRDVGSRDSLHKLAGKRWMALDYAEGLVRVGVQSAEEHPETAALIRRLMRERDLEVPPEGRTLDSICVVGVCRPPDA